MNVNSSTVTKAAQLPQQNQPAQNPQAGGDPLSNMFLKLLVAQIQNQSPLNPTDGTEYVSQLAQLAQVQSMENMSQIAQNNAILMDNLQVLSTAGLVGKEVMVRTDEIELGTETVHGRLTLDHADEVYLILKDSAGVEHKVELGQKEKGQVEFELNPEELGLPEGKYEIKVVSKNGNQESSNEIPVEIAGRVTNVRIPVEGGGMVINVAGIGEVPYYKLSQIGPKESTESTELMKKRAKYEF